MSPNARILFRMIGVAAMASLGLGVMIGLIYLMFQPYQPYQPQPSNPEFVAWCAKIGGLYTPDTAQTWESCLTPCGNRVRSQTWP